MDTRRFQVLLEWDAESKLWVTHVPALNHLSTYGESRTDALEQTREAILGYLETAAQEGIAVPDPELDAELLEMAVPVA